MKDLGSRVLFSLFQSQNLLLSPTKNHEEIPPLRIYGLFKGILPPITLEDLIWYFYLRKKFDLVKINPFEKQKTKIWFKNKTITSGTEFL